MGEKRVVQGVVKDISFGVEKYNEHFQKHQKQCWLTIGDVKCSGNINANNGQYVLKDSSHNEVKVGMLVTATCDVNGQYMNFKVSKLDILASGMNTTPQPTAPHPAEQPQKPVEQRSTPQVDNNAIIRSNCLVAAAIKAHGSLSQEDYKKLDMDMLYRAADTYMDYCKNGRK